MGGEKDGLVRWGERNTANLGPGNQGLVREDRGTIACRKRGELRGGIVVGMETGIRGGGRLHIVVPSLTDLVRHC